MTGLTALLRIDLPGGSAFLSDGGVTEYDGNTYTPNDDTLGSLSSIEALSEGVDGEVPALSLGFAAPGAGAITALSNGALQQSAVRLWVAEYDSQTGLVVGTPELRFTGIVDQPQITAAFRQLSIAIVAVPEAELLFSKPTGNALSSTFHKALYAGETGHDNATGLSVQVAWGVEGPPAATSSNGSRGGGGSPFDQVAR